MKSLTLKISMAVLSMIPLVAKAELIVLASPQSNDAYYAKMIDSIFDFHVDYAKKIIKNGDNVVVLTDKGLYPDYVKALGKKHVAIAPMHDILDARLHQRQSSSTRHVPLHGGRTRWR